MHEQTHKDREVRCQLTAMRESELGHICVVRVVAMKTAMSATNLRDDLIRARTPTDKDDACHSRIVQHQK